MLILETRANQKQKSVHASTVAGGVLSFQLYISVSSRIPLCLFRFYINDAH